MIKVDMKIAVLAANGRTGKVFVEQALATGHALYTYRTRADKMVRRQRGGSSSRVRKKQLCASGANYQ